MTKTCKRMVFWTICCLTLSLTSPSPASDLLLASAQAPQPVAQQSSRRAVTDAIRVPWQSGADGWALPIQNELDRRPANERETEDNSATSLGLPSWETWTSPDRIIGSIRVVAVMAALSLAPALLLMTTCYIRLIVVFGLLRHALGSQQLPPQQVTTTLAMFLTVLIMWPVWNQVHENAIKPYSDPEVEMSSGEAWQLGIAPVRDFMIGQIQRAGNGADVAMFLDYLDISQVDSNEDIPLQALLPAFLISELKIAFLIGFQIFLPFVLLDLVVSSVTMSMGMVMVPPTTISLPLKLIMFVLVDGWHLVVEMLLMSFASS